MLRAWVLVAALLPVAGCLGPDDERAPAITPIGAADGRTDERFFGARLDGPVAIQSRLRLDGPNSCAMAGFAHHPLSYAYLPDVYWSLDRIAEDGAPVSITGGILPVPYPQGRAHVGPVDSRALTAPVAQAVWGTYFTAVAGEQTGFVSWSGIEGLDLEAGTYFLTAYATRAVRPEANERIGNASLATGIECRDGFQVLSESYGTAAVLLTPYGVHGDVDVGTEMFGPEVHQGSLRFTAVGEETMLYTVGARMLGEVGFEGPVSERLSLDHTDTPNVPLADQPIPRYWRWLPPGEYEVSWDLTGPATMYWVFGLASYQPAPADWGESNWDRPF